MSSVTVVTPERERAHRRFWIGLHALCLLLLLLGWLVAVELRPPPSLESKYAFAPRLVPLQRFQHFFAVLSAQFALWTLVVACAAVWFAWQKPSARGSRAIRASRWLLCVLSLLFVVVFVIAQTKSTHYAEEIELSRQDIGSAFSELFCETHALQVCAQEDELEKLMVVIGGDQPSSTTSSTASTSTATDTSKAATLAIWLRCRDLLVANHGRVSPQQLKLLSDFNATKATDSWCGSHFLREANGDTAAAVATSSGAAAESPFDLNPEVFTLLSQEWPTRLKGSWSLAAAALVVVALSWRLKKLTAEATDGFELVDVKSGQRTNAGSTPRAMV